MWITVLLSPFSPPDFLPLGLFPNSYWKTCKSKISRSPWIHSGWSLPRLPNFRRLQIASSVRSSLKVPTAENIRVCHGAGSLYKFIFLHLGSEFLLTPLFFKASEITCDAVILFFHTLVEGIFDVSFRKMIDVHDISIEW